jgi:hypothetical protein
MSFFILVKTTDGGKTWEPEFDKHFPTGQEASARAKENNAYYDNLCQSDDYYKRIYGNVRYRVRKVVDTDDDNYIAREAAKNHAPLPWLEDYPTVRYGQPWMLPHLDPDKEHFVRFYARIDHAIEDKYTSMRFSRFLDNYMGLDDTDVQDLLVKLGVYKDAAFGITNDPELIQRVYMDGPTSCMNDPENYPIQDDPHPSVVYSEGDFAVAYIQNGDSFSARAVVCPEKKIYYSGYGHTSLLLNHLKEAGYERKTSYQSYLGLRIKAMRDNDGNWLMPYVDMCSYAQLDEDAGFFILAGSGWEIQTTDGYAYEEEQSYDDYDSDY